jgi:hypothetical protein
LLLRARLSLQEWLQLSPSPRGRETCRAISGTETESSGFN